ncbi:MAG: hypothetical protein GY838_03985 [bacterium]|nr:hypothetical protein [bacterium]
MDAWTDTKGLAVIFGCSVGNVRKTIVPHVDARHHRREKGRHQYKIAGVVADYLTHRIAQHDQKQRRTAAEQAAGGDEMLAGGGDEKSPWLEKYREEQTGIAKIKRLQLEGQLIPLDLVNNTWAFTATVDREALEKQERIVAELPPNTPKEILSCFNEMLRIAREAREESKLANDRLCDNSNDGASG